MTNEQAKQQWAAWCDEFITLPQQPMDEMCSAAFFNSILFEQARTELPQPIVDSFPYKVMEGHARRIGLVVSPAVIAFVSIGVARGNPGTCVMYVHALRRYQQKHNIGLLDTTVLVEAFPNGFPDDHALSDMWGKQKGHILDAKFDNLLDVVSP